jgi:thiamine biosynthesis lipoprotein
MAAATVVSPARPGYYFFGREGILGTSLDITFAAASHADATRAETAVLDEVERLRRILSSYDDSSEISRLASTGRLDDPSPDLIAVLDAYARWNARTGGAYSARVGALSALWKAADLSGHVPGAEVIAMTAVSSASRGWTFDSAHRVVTSTTSERLDLSSLGKGYVIDRAMTAAPRAVPALRGGMVNIGGDIRVWGQAPEGDGRWRIGVADPRDPAENARQLTRLRLTNRAVSSSGSYARGYDIAGHHYSHIIDPRSGYPASVVIGATVIARDNATANALATTLSVIGPDAGMRLIRGVQRAEALIVTADGDILRSPGFAAYEEGPTVSRPGRAAGIIQGTISLDVTPSQWVRRRPYVAVWITNATGQHVRTLAMWGDRYKYQRDLSKWWALVGRDNGLVDAVTRATRNVGKYVLEWDGFDQRGTAMPAGTYTFWLEAAYQNGPHSARGTTLTCGATEAAAAIDATDAFSTGRVTCSRAMP